MSKSFDRINSLNRNYLLEASKKKVKSCVSAVNSKLLLFDFFSSKWNGNTNKLNHLPLAARAGQIDIFWLFRHCTVIKKIERQKLSTSAEKKTSKRLNLNNRRIIPRYSTPQGSNNSLKQTSTKMNLSAIKIEIQTISFCDFPLIK